MNSLFANMIGALLCLAALLAVAAADETATEGEKPSPEDVRFFETKVRPLLAAKCFKCHSDQKQEGDLRLDGRAWMLAGGDSGAAIEPGKPDESLLVEAINHESFEMPPSGKMPQADIDTLTDWIRRGAPWPGDDGKVVKREKLTDEDRAWWAFQPVAEVDVPDVQDDADWCKNEIDRFILARLQEKNLRPTAEADRRTLIRRLYYDLLGVPPSPEEVKAFLEDKADGAYERLVDRLLDDPRYGERYARHWLDLVRYAESDGYRQDAYRPEAWKYRDYVIRSLNEDKPFKQFAAEQLAGDEIAPGDKDVLAATIYLRHTQYEHNQRDVRAQRQMILDDITDTTADVFLGMGYACARCHDHKFDPILHKDYYALQAFFTPLMWREDVPVATLDEQAAYQRQLAQWETATAEIRRELDEIERPILLANSGGEGFAKFTDDLKAMIRKRPEQRAPLEHQLAELSMRQIKLDPSILSKKLTGEKKQRWEALKSELARHIAKKPKPLPTFRFGVKDCGNEAPPTYIVDKERLGPVAPGYLTVMNLGEVAVTSVPAELNSTGRRTTLAQWIGDDDNPLSTRVITNRIWGWHFGAGLASNTSDFGRLGEKPTHPQLLDWLTRRFVDGGWRMKPLHRLIVTSATYRQAVREDSSAMLVDPTNRLYWRQSIRRLDAEQIRDAALVVSGELDRKTGGPAVTAAAPRRSIYTRVERNKRDALLEALDAPDGIASTANRDTTTTAVQALLLINGDWMLSRAEKLAKRITDQKMANDTLKVQRLWQLVYGRSASEAEVEAAIEFLDTPTNSNGPKKLSPAGEPPSGVVVKQFPDRGQALDIKPSQKAKPAFDDHAKLPAGDFTIEAVVLLRSLAEDASVRTIASHWDSGTNNPGWAFGVTSKKSKYTPQNLILQLVGKTKDGEIQYEVIPSGLLLDLNQPYYVAASVDIDDPSEAGVTFYVQPLGKDAELKTAGVKHEVVGDYRPALPLLLGGRPLHPRHNWDGLIDEVRLSSCVLSQDELLIGSTADQAEETLAWWNFEHKKNLLADASGAEAHLSYKTQPTKPSDGNFTALVDLCHVLLNSNEFLYVE